MGFLGRVMIFGRGDGGILGGVMGMGEGGGLGGIFGVGDDGWEKGVGRGRRFLVYLFIYFILFTFFS